MIPVLHRERVALTLALVEFLVRDSDFGKKGQQAQKGPVCGKIWDKK